jgi:hypothetical protein
MAFTLPLTKSYSKWEGKPALSRRLALLDFIIEALSKCRRILKEQP